MTKKTTKKAKKRAPKELTRKQRSRLEREKRLERFLLWGVTIVGILVVTVLGYGLVVEKIIKAREPVAIVDGTPITTAEFQARVRFTRMRIRNELEYWLRQQQTIDPTDSSAQYYLEYIQGNIRDSQTRLSEANVQTIGEQALNELIQEELVRQEAERRGITVTPDEVQQSIESYFGYDRNPATPVPAPAATPPLTPTDVLTPTPTDVPLPTPTLMTEQDFQRLYDTYLKQSLKPLGISEQQYRSWAQSSVLIEKLREQMSAEVPTTADQVKLRILTVDSEEQASELAARLDAGEDLQTLADELGENTYSTELDWLPRNVLESRLGAELADQAFNLEVGEHGQPVLSPDGTMYIIIEVAGHETHELAQPLREQLGQEAFEEWLDAQQKVLVELRTYADRVPTEP